MSIPPEDRLPPSMPNLMNMTGGESLIKGRGMLSVPKLCPRGIKTVHSDS